MGSSVSYEISTEHVRQYMKLMICLFLRIKLYKEKKKIKMKKKEKKYTQTYKLTKKRYEIQDTRYKKLYLTSVTTV